MSLDEVIAALTSPLPFPTKEIDMQSYLLIGGNHDGLNFPVAEGKDEARIPVGGGGRETYIRDTLSVGAASVTIYRHESLTSEQVLSRLVELYKAWCVNRPLRQGK